MQQTLIRYCHRWSSAAKVEEMWQGTGTYDRLMSSLIAVVALGSTHGPLLASWATPLLSHRQLLLLFCQRFFLVTLWDDSLSFLAQKSHFSSTQPVRAPSEWGGTLLTQPRGHWLNDLSGVCAPFCHPGATKCWDVSVPVYFLYLLSLSPPLQCLPCRPSWHQPLSTLGIKSC